MRRSRFTGFAVGLTVLGMLIPTARAQSFYIDEMTDWTGNGCQAEDLDECTSKITQRLQDAGWTGHRYVNSNAFPQDIVESCDASSYGPKGKDWQYGDGADLLIIDGHGNTGFLAFAYKRYDTCTVDLGSSGDVTKVGVARLGSMSGASASVAMWLTCCTLKKESLTAHANHQWLRQQLGFHGEALLGDTMPRDFWDENYSKSNKQAWLDSMEDAWGWFTGDNSPIVVSYGSSSDQATDNHNSMSLYHNVQFPRAGGPACGGRQPRFYYVLTVRDHGSEGCN